MKEDFFYTIVIAAVYSIIVFVDERIKPEEREKLKDKWGWIAAITNGAIDVGFSLFSFIGLGHFMPQLPTNLAIGTSVIIGIYLREKLINSLGKRISEWKV